MTPTQTRPQETRAFLLSCLEVSHKYNYFKKLDIIFERIRMLCRFFKTIQTRLQILRTADFEVRGASTIFRNIIKSPWLCCGGKLKTLHVLNEQSNSSATKQSFAKKLQAVGKMANTFETLLGSTLDSDPSESAQTLIKIIYMNR